MKRAIHFVCFAALTSGCVSSPAKAESGSSTKNAIHTHIFRDGESFLYNYDDTDITYCGDLKGGITVATDPLAIQQIKIFTKTDVSGPADNLSHKIGILSGTEFREADASKFGAAQFSPVSKLIKNYPASMSYSYPSESYALSHLFDLFKTSTGNPGFMADPVSQILFFKTQDVHQMQDSALEVHDGLMPGESYITPAHDTQGLGGKFTGGPAQYLYVDTEKLDGVNVAQVRVTNLGNQFSTDSVNVFTNFTFTMYIALEGSKKGLLISGTGQETAYPKQSKPDDQCPHPVLQRQFSIRLK